MLKAIKNVVSSVYLGFCYEDENETPEKAPAESRDSCRIKRHVTEYIHTDTDSWSRWSNNEDINEKTYQNMYETMQEVYDDIRDDLYDDLLDDICDDIYEDRYVDKQYFCCDRCAGYIPLSYDRHNFQSRPQHLPEAYAIRHQLDLVSPSTKSSNPNCRTQQSPGRSPNDSKETGSCQNVSLHKVKPKSTHNSHQNLSSTANQMSGDREFRACFSSRSSLTSVIIPQPASSSFVDSKTTSVSTTSLKIASISHNNSKTASSLHGGSKKSSSLNISSKTKSSSNINSKTKSISHINYKTKSNSNINSKAVSNTGSGLYISSSFAVTSKTGSCSEVGYLPKLSSSINSMAALNTGSGLHISLSGAVTAKTRSCSEVSCLPASSSSASSTTVQSIESFVPTSTTPTGDQQISAQFQEIEKHMQQYLLDTSSDAASVISSLRAPSFPFKKNVIVTWYKQPVSRPHHVEPDGLPLRARVDMINLNFVRSSKTLAVVFQKLRLRILAEEEELLFHATHAAAAADILLKGINMNKCKGRRDFSHNYGFYTTPDYKKSVKWGLRKSRNTKGNCGAIVAFKVNKELRLEQHLDLEVTTKQGKERWKKVIQYFRLGQACEEVETSLRGVKYIRGPVLVNTNLRAGAAPQAGTKPFQQVCICDEQFAKRFGSLANIFFVIFFNNISDEEECEDES